MTKGKGYLLPAGDATEDDLECCLVFYPARDEYRRALMGSLDYLATWIAWERDSEKRGQDAAAAWKLANIQTWECCNMGYCDDLLTTLEALLAATTALECCGDQDITDGRQYTDEIVDGEGDVPQNIIDAGYADDAADWDGFDDYKCMISHLAVDHIETFFREISPFISDTGLVIGGIGVVGALLGAILVVVGLPISAGILVALGAAAGIWSWISKYGRDAVDDLADDIATNHDALACAIYQGDGVTDAIANFEDVVDELFGAIDATAIKAVGFEPQLRAMYAGRYDQEDIAENLANLGYDVGSYDCSACPAEYEIVATWDYTVDDLPNPDTESRMEWVAAFYMPWIDDAGVRTFAVPGTNGSYFYQGSNIAEHGGAPAYSGTERLYVQRIEFDWWPGPTCANKPRVLAITSYYPIGMPVPTPEGTYFYEWEPGSEPQLTSVQQAGLGAVFTTGNMDHLNDNGFITRLVISGYVAEES